MLVKIEARILIFPDTDFHFPSTSVPPGTFLKALAVGLLLSSLHCPVLLLTSSVVKQHHRIRPNNIKLLRNVTDVYAVSCSAWFQGT